MEFRGFQLLACTFISKQNENSVDPEQLAFQASQKPADLDLFLLFTKQNISGLNMARVNSEIIAFIIYKVMKYRKIFIRYNAYFKKAVFHSRENIKSCILQPWEYKLYLTSEIGCPLLSPLTSLSPLQNFKPL